jgi:hypothetical protein
MQRDTLWVQCPWKKIENGEEGGIEEEELDCRKGGEKRV